MKKINKQLPLAHLAKRNPIATGFVLLSCVGIVAYFVSPLLMRHQSATSHGGGFAVPVEARKVTVQSIEDSAITVGSVKADESVIIRSEIAGRIKEIHFKEGTNVQRGALLITLDDEVHKADLAEANANLSLSRGNYERVEKLFREKFKSSQEEEKASAEYKRDQAILDRSKAMFEKTKITAPFNGLIGLRMISPGDYITTGQDMVNLENIESVKIDFRLPEIYVSKAKIGQEITIQSDAMPDREFKGKVFAINPLLDENGRSLALRAVVDNVDRSLLPGMFVSVNIVLQKHNNAILIPEEALVPKGNENYVFRIIENKAKFTKVITGIRQDGKVHIVQGLTAQDSVITAGHLKIQDGSDVQVIAAESCPK